MTAGRSLRLAAFVGVLLAGAFGSLLPAGAHGPTGTLGIEVTPGSAPLTADVRVLLTYANDGDGASGATVVVHAFDPIDLTVPRQPLTDDGRGRYSGTVTFPHAGPWTVVVDATNPAATVQSNVTVSAAPAPTTTTAVTRPERFTPPASAEADDASGLPEWFIIVGLVVLVALVVGTGLFVRGRPPNRR